MSDPMGYERGRMNIRKTQGVLFAYHLSNRWLVLKLLRILPVGWIRVENIQYLRRASSLEFIEPSWRRVLLFWRYWYWPYPLGLIFNRASVLYMLKLRNGTRVYLRLNPSLHFLLRTAVGASLVDEEGEQNALPPRPAAELAAAPRSAPRADSRPRRGGSGQM